MKNAITEDSREYLEFLKKFEEKKTTDDYEVVEWKLSEREKAIVAELDRGEL